MKIFWNKNKNQQLIKNRNISFEDVEIAILEDKILDILADMLMLYHLLKKVIKYFLKPFFQVENIQKKYLRGDKN